MVDRTGSTNSDLVAAAGEGAPDLTVLLAEEQVAGRGRLGRTWSAPARSQLIVSVLVRPAVAPDRLGTLPLVTGVALAEAVRGLGVDAALAESSPLAGAGSSVSLRPAGAASPASATTGMGAGSACEPAAPRALGSAAGSAAASLLWPESADARGPSMACDPPWEGASSR